MKLINSSASASLLELINNHSFKPTPARGEIITGTYEGSGLVSYGGKSDGVVDSTDLKNRPLKVGEKLQFLVIGSAEDEGLVRLSHTQAEGWTTLVSARESGEVLTTRVERIALKGNRKPAGLLLSINGVSGFISSRSLGVSTGALEEFVGKEVDVQVQMADPSKGRVVFDRSKLVQERKDAFLASIKVGDKVSGTIVNVTDFGAFVEIGEGIQGLLHKSQLQGGLKDLKVGSAIETTVSRVDTERARISLTTRGVGKEERDALMENYLETVSEGDVLKGKVSHLVDYGVFVEVSDGIQGLVHISDDRNRVFTPGEEVEAVVLGTRNNRLALSVAQVAAKRFLESIREGDQVEATVIGLIDCAAFVRLGDSPCEGFLHVKNMLPEKKGALEIGDRITVEVKELNPGSDRRTAVSMVA